MYMLYICPDTSSSKPVYQICKVCFRFCNGELVHGCFIVQTYKRTNTDATAPQIRKFCFKFRNREVVNAFRRMKEEVQVFLLLSLSLSLSLPLYPPLFLLTPLRCCLPIDATRRRSGYSVSWLY